MDSRGRRSTHNGGCKLSIEEDSTPPDAILMTDLVWDKESNPLEYTFTIPPRVESRIEEEELIMSTFSNHILTLPKWEQILLKSAMEEPNLEVSLCEQLEQGEQLYL
jgi:hypothetical protein